jgi:hypothetical protein
MSKNPLAGVLDRTEPFILDAAVPAIFWSKRNPRRAGQIDAGERLPIRSASGYPPANRNNLAGTSNEHQKTGFGQSP